MAVHYYDEDDIKPGSKISCKVVVNHRVKLSPAEIKKAKKQAFENVIQEEKDRLKNKKKPSKVKTKTPAAPTLF